jgi:hypothetical protein
MIKRFLLILFLLPNVAGALYVLNVSQFTFINSIFVDVDVVILATDGGVVLLDAFPRRVRATLVTDYPVDVAYRDHLTKDVYFISNGDLYRWDPFMTWPTKLGFVGRVTSISSDREYLYLEKDGTITKFTKFGNSLGTTSPPPNLRWAGRRGEVERGDPFLIYLAPYFVQKENLGRVDFTVFVKDPDPIKLWVGTEGAGVYIYNTQTWRVEDSIVFGLLPKETYAIFGMHDSLWIGGDHGLTLKVREDWISFSKNGIFDLSCDEIRDLSGDQGILWALTDCGLLRYQPSSFYLKKVSHITRIASIDAHSPYLFVGGERGIGWMPLSGGEIDWVKNSSSLDVLDIVSARRYVYILTTGGVLLYDLEGRSWNALKDPREWSLSLALKGSVKGDTVLIATERGILEVMDGREEYAYIDPPFSPNRVQVNAILLARAGIYVGTDSGLYLRERKTKTWRRYGIQDGLAGERIYSLWANRDTIYVGTDRGITILVP